MLMLLRLLWGKFEGEPEQGRARVVVLLARGRGRSSSLSAWTSLIRRECGSKGGVATSPPNNTFQLNSYHANQTTAAETMHPHLHTKDNRSMF
jgi:hypothetical protein